MGMFGEFVRAPRDLWMLLGSVGNAITLALIAGFSLSFPPLVVLVQNFGEWTQFLWNLIPFWDVTEFTAKALTVITISLLVLLRGFLAKHPTLFEVLNPGASIAGDAFDSYRARIISLVFRWGRLVLGALGAFASMGNLTTTLFPALQNWGLYVIPAVQEWGLYVAILSISSYYPRAFFSLIWAIALVLAIDVSGNWISTLFVDAPWNTFL